MSHGPRRRIVSKIGRHHDERARGQVQGDRGSAGWRGARGQRVCSIAVSSQPRSLLSGRPCTALWRVHMDSEAWASPPSRCCGRRWVTQGCRRPACFCSRCLHPRSKRTSACGMSRWPLTCPSPFRLLQCCHSPQVRKLEETSEPEGGRAKARHNVREAVRCLLLHPLCFRYHCAGGHGYDGFRGGSLHRWA